MEQLTDYEYNLIVEALLFSSCLEITDQWSEIDRECMLQIADKLKSSSTTLKNIELHTFDKEQNHITRSICNLFPFITSVNHENIKTTNI